MTPPEERDFDSDMAELRRLLAEAHRMGFRYIRGSMERVR